MIKVEYINLKDSTFVPLDRGINESFQVNMKLINQDISKNTNDNTSI